MLQQVFSWIADGQDWPLDKLAAATRLPAAQLADALAQLDAMGAVFRERNAQHCQLDAPVELLDEGQIRRQLSPAVLPDLASLQIDWSLPSTNQHCMALSGSLPAGGVVCLAEHQTAGRGRRGRQWCSPLGANLYLSAGWRYAEGVGVTEGLSLAIGVVIADVLAQDFCVPGIGLKWPNDMLCQQRKVAGILIESQLDQDGACAIAVGIGINANMTAAAVSAIDQPVTSMNLALGHSISRNALAACVINRLLQLLKDFPATTFAGYREAWEKRNAHRGQQLSLSVNQQAVTGTVIGVDNRGALRLAINGSEQVFDAGELRLPANPPAWPAG